MATKKEIGISYNIAVELSNDFSIGLNKPPLPLIIDIAEWMQSMYASKSTLNTLDVAYAVAASIRAVAKMAKDNNIYILEAEKWKKIPSEDLTLKQCFTLANLITNAILKRLR